MLQYVVSNIKATDFPKYNSAVKGEDKAVVFYTQPTIMFYDFSSCGKSSEGPCFADKVDPVLLKEAEQILAQSKFN